MSSYDVDIINQKTLLGHSDNSGSPNYLVFMVAS